MDQRTIRAAGGKGGDGFISFLRLWCNENAGPDGGDGGHGGHVIFQATSNVKDLGHITTHVVEADDGVNGSSRNCHGKNAEHKFVNVPIGTLFKNPETHRIIGDLSREGLLFVAARGGAGGKGNCFFTTDTEQAPQISELGADGENIAYFIEVKSMANVGLIGFPNAGKSTLLRAVSRARPKVAPYPFTTLKPYIGMVQYADLQQLAIADLPGLIEDSHKNKGLGFQFLKHMERCAALVFVIDASLEGCGDHYETLRYELKMFNPELIAKPHLIVANKMDLPESAVHIKSLEGVAEATGRIIKISAKDETNLDDLLKEIRLLYDSQVALEEAQQKGDDTSASSRLDHIIV